MRHKRIEPEDGRRGSAFVRDTPYPLTPVSTKTVLRGLTVSVGASISAASGSTGRWFLSKLVRVIDQLAFFYVCLKVMVRHRKDGRRLVGRVVVEQIFFTGVQSLELIAFLALLTGALVIVQGIEQLAKVGGLQSLGVVLITVLIREIGPLAVAVIITLRSGSAIALEIGYMNVLGEIEALEMQGIPTLHFICVPRLVGVTVAVVCLMILFDLVAIAGGFFAAWTVTGTTVWNFLYSLSVEVKRSDIMIVLTKGICFGLTIPVVCMYHGFQAQGAITAVPLQVSKALVGCLLYCVVLNIMISFTFSF